MVKSPKLLRFDGQTVLYLKYNLMVKLFDHQIPSNSSNTIQFDHQIPIVFEELQWGLMVKLYCISNTIQFDHQTVLYLKSYWGLTQTVLYLKYI